MTVDHKIQADRLGEHLAHKHGVKLKHASLLEAIAVIHGARDWNTLSARMDPSSVHPTEKAGDAAAGGAAPQFTSADALSWIMARLHCPEVDSIHLCAAGPVRAVESHSFKVMERAHDGRRKQVATLSGVRGDLLAENVLNLAGLSTDSDSAIPQEGRFAVEGAHKRKAIWCSVASLPTVHGRYLVLRPHRESALRTVSDLGLTFGNQWFEAVLHGPLLTVVTGPTGSGKSTTLLATASELAQRERSICLVSEYPSHLQDVTVLGICKTPAGKGGYHPSIARTLDAAGYLDPDHVIIDEERLDGAALERVVSLLGKGVRVTLSIHAASASNAVRRLAPLLNPASLDMEVGVLAQQMLSSALPGQRRIAASHFCVISPRDERDLDRLPPNDTVADALALMASGAVSPDAVARVYGPGALPGEVATLDAA